MKKKNVIPKFTIIDSVSNKNNLLIEFYKYTLNKKVLYYGVRILDDADDIHLKYDQRAFAEVSYNIIQLGKVEKLYFE
jgi:hypothetical protein